MDRTPRALTASASRCGSPGRGPGSGPSRDPLGAPARLPRVRGAAGSWGPRVSGARCPIRGSRGTALDSPRRAPGFPRGLLLASSRQTRRPPPPGAARSTCWRSRFHAQGTSDRSTPSRVRPGLQREFAGTVGGLQELPQECLNLIILLSGAQGSPLALLSNHSGLGDPMG